MKRIPLLGRDALIEAHARTLYDEGLPYHNFAHVLDTLRAADRILARCDAERVDDTVVYHALLFHDAGYHHDHAARGYSSKEAYSAALARAALTAAGVAADRVRETVDAILATERDAICVSAEQKAVRAADLSGMAAGYAQFIAHSLALKREYAYLQGKTPSWHEWQQISAQVLAVYLAQEIELTGYCHDASGESAFHVALRGNLQRLLAEPVEPRAD